MTREEAKQKVKIEKREVYPYDIDDNVDEVIDKIFDYFKTNEAGLKRRLDTAIKTIKTLQKSDVRTCDGCKHYEYDSVDGCSYCIQYERDFSFICDRLCKNDRYEAKGE